MTLSPREHPAARREFLKVLAWYGTREIELAARFIQEARESLELVCEWPDGAPPYWDIERTPPVRSKRISGFPYRIIYLVHDNVVVVVAYAHERRRPGYWRGRLEST